VVTATPAVARAPARPAVAALHRAIRGILGGARLRAAQAVDQAMVQAYWQVGRLIVEHEQQGRRRAAYGETVLADLSRRLTAEYGSGFDATNLRKMRQFYQLFAIRDAVRLESDPASARRSARIRDAVRRESVAERPLVIAGLSWSHFRILLHVEDSTARAWYMHEAAAQHWSTRQLDRQVATLYYERLTASRHRAPVRREAATKLAELTVHDVFRDPYVLEFLDLKDHPALRESTIEQAIIGNLQDFLLELGKGFSFVARQKRIRFEDEDFYVDLVFYHYLLKCFVLIDLKVGKLTHQDIGQMDAYVRLFDAHLRPAGDNPTIGLILCSQKNQAIAKYSVLSEGRQIFAAKYVHHLPSEADLRRTIERERTRIESSRTSRETP